MSEKKDEIELNFSWLDTAPLEEQGDNAYLQQQDEAKQDNDSDSENKDTSNVTETHSEEFAPFEISLHLDFLKENVQPASQNESEKASSEIANSDVKEEYGNIEEIPNITTHEEGLSLNLATSLPDAFATQGPLLDGLSLPQTVFQGPQTPEEHVKALQEKQLEGGEAYDSDKEGVPFDFQALGGGVAPQNLSSLDAEQGQQEQEVLLQNFSENVGSDNKDGLNLGELNNFVSPPPQPLEGNAFIPPPPPLNLQDQTHFVPEAELSKNIENNEGEVPLAQASPAESAQAKTQVRQAPEKKEDSTVRVTKSKIQAASSYTEATSATNVKKSASKKAFSIGEKFSFLKKETSAKGIDKKAKPQSKVALLIFLTVVVLGGYVVLDTENITSLKAMLGLDGSESFTPDSQANLLPPPPPSPLPLQPTPAESQKNPVQNTAKNAEAHVHAEPKHGTILSEKARGKKQEAVDKISILLKQVQPVQINMLLVGNGPNQIFFKTVSEAINDGDAIAAIQAFKTPLSAQLTSEEENLAKLLEARYYMLISDYGKARKILTPLCTSVLEQPLFCVYYIRSLISSRSVGEAEKLLSFVEKNLDENSPWAPYVQYLQLLKLGVLLQQKLEIKTLNIFVDNMLSSLAIEREWFRQRNLWFVQALARSPRNIRYNLTKFLLVDKRNGLMNAWENARSSGLTAGDPLTMAYLNYLAVYFDFKPLQLSVAQKFSVGKELQRVAKIFEVLETHFQGKVVDGKLRELEALLTKSLYAEIPRLMQINAFIGEQKIDDAYQAIRSYYGNIKEIRFGIAWKHILAQWQLLSSYNPTMIKKYVEALEADAAQQIFLQNDFYHWLLITRLRREMMDNPRKTLEKAKALALTPHEKALVAVETAYILRSERKAQEAMQLLDTELQKQPNHYLLLHAAIEIASAVNLDPAPFIQRQNTVTLLPYSHILFPLIFEDTVYRILDSL